MMRRYPDWPERLTQFLLGRRAEPFRYGAHDCCLFVADAVQAMTGEDLAVRFRGQYHSRREARTLARSPETALAEEAAQRDLREVPPGFAGRGDLVAMRLPRHSVLGLVGLNGQEILIAAVRGFARLPLSRAARAWKV